jgi:hypothetical protein
MSSSITTKTSAQPFAGRPTVQAGVGQEMVHREIVRAEGEERNGVDGPFRQS